MAKVLEKEAAISSSNIAVVTTAETVAATSPVMNTPRDVGRAVIKAWVILTTGAATTAVTCRIRRGDTATGGQVGEANAETIKAAAGSSEPFYKVGVEDRSGVASIQYSLTVEQTGATGNGTVLQSGIEIEFLG
jgi:hypothetical protein